MDRTYQEQRCLQGGEHGCNGSHLHATIAFISSLMHESRRQNPEMEPYGAGGARVVREQGLLVWLREGC